MKYMQILTLSSFLIFMISCNPEQEYPDHSIEINMYMVNTLDEVVTSFNQGEVPILVLEITNRGEEIRLNPALHYGEHILLYPKGKDDDLLGIFYKNGQISNEIRPTIFKGNARTIIRFPWVWTGELEAEIIELDLNGQELSRRFSSNTFADPQNNLLSTGTYVIRILLPSEWEIGLNQNELVFHIK